jgi:NAD(P)-dependent dehydrogenase (short-subunit alcohol dehydrogenase family)
MLSVVITGSSQGIGLGLAREFLKRSCRVVLSARGRDRLETEGKQLVDEFGADRVISVTCDVCDLKQVRFLWDEAARSFGRVDIWINNAGITHTTQLLQDLPSEEISSVIATNITGLIYGCQVALRGMLKQGCGQIYNLEGHGSDGRKRKGLSIYGATKRAVRHFTEALILETEDTPVRVGMLSPGIVLTDFILDDLRKMPQEQRETIQAIYNCLADTVETVTPFLAEQILANQGHGAEIAWLTDEKAHERFNSDEYTGRDLFTKYGF